MKNGWKMIIVGKYDLMSKEHDLVVYRDEHGKFHVRIDGVVVHKRWSATEIVMWAVGMFIKEDLT
jgi:hypothetical protein